MADQCDLCLLGLIILSSLLTGSSGVNETHVFISSGENVHLPCNNALSDCKSTTWIYNRRSAAVALIELGIKKKNSERLSLGSDCSLNIKNVTEEDYGSYSCQQWTGPKGKQQKQGTDARVYLHVLHVSPSSSSSSSSSSQTEISPGHSVTLSCQLYSYTGFSCDDWVRSKGLHLLWVNQADVDLKTDSRYQILFSSYHCIITLTTTLLNEDDNREWRCQLILRNQLQTSVRYTVKYSVSSSNSEKKSSQTLNSERTAAAQTPGFTEQQGPADTASETEVSVTAGSLFRVIVIIVEMAVFAAPTVILLQIICARRAGRKDSQHPEEIEMPTMLQ
ncbi:uncharacterized protein LOC125248720 [Megalobrama amblycephala]|uniref:uncharacterized protein LOC125248720 n=1 Tax=Megalobrama amblycephala TaxID=75352 RepID=UPI002013F030|nr:uncharacterized protein LOC125248720 [Megalobrama amblycephala]